MIRQLLCAVSLLLTTVQVPAAEPDLSKIRLPEGFRIDFYAKGIKNARSMTLSPSGVVYVGSRNEGKVYALPDRDKDGRADEVITIARGLNSPNGVAWRNGSLYVAEISRVLRFDGVEKNLKKAPPPKTVSAAFPTDRHHGWKFIRFSPDGWLHVPVGAPCNICEKDDERYASIMRMKPDGSGLEVYARGVRNTVGFDFHPETGELWFTDNGGDMLGDDIPPDELNHATKKGQHFGYPYCHGGDIPDPEFGDKRPCGEFIPPARRLGPHVASLGMRFYDGKMFPAKYRGDIFIAERGSWNRTVPIGYRVTRVTLKDGKATGYEPFAEGWLEKAGQPGEKKHGRPVDVQVMPDGALLVSDDTADAIYRISYREGRK